MKILGLEKTDTSDIKSKKSTRQRCDPVDWQGFFGADLFKPFCPDQTLEDQVAVSI